MNQKIKKGIITTTVLGTIVTGVILGGVTYSKYITKIDGTGNATIARWSFKANNETETMANIKLSNTYDEEKILKNTIAPGTSGSFDINLDATGADVAIDYKVEFDNLVNKPKNIKFTYEGKTVSSLKELEDVLQGRINLDDARTKILTINWEWPYTTGITENEIATNDRIDTGDAAKTFTFDIKVTGTQVNPNYEK